MHFRGRPRSVVESLENRRLLSVAVNAKKATLEVVGTEGADDISIRANATLINVVDVVIKNAAGRSARSVTVGRFHHLNVQAGGGDDRISIDKSLAGLAPEVDCWLDAGAGNDTVQAGALPGTIALRDGNDRVTLASDASLKIYGDGGDDRIEISGKAIYVDAGAGRDTLVVGAGNHTINGGDGNDNVRATNRSGSINGGGDADAIALDATKSAGTATVAHGDAGRDTLKGTAGADSLYGDADDDVVIGRGGTGDALYGGDGDDVLDARSTKAATLFGGAGNDDLYAGADSTGKGEAGRDWFSDDKWREKDQDADDVAVGGSPNSGSYAGSSSLTISTGLIDFAGGLYASLSLYRLSDLGFVTASGGTAAKALRTVPYLKDGASYSPRSSPALSVAERNGVRTGVVRLPINWQVGDAHRINADFAWYDVRLKGYGDSGGSAAEFGAVYQLCVKRGTVIVTEEGVYTSNAKIIRARGDVAAMWLPAGATARVAGSDATYRIAETNVPEIAAKPPKKGQRGLLVDGGVLWLSYGDVATTFVAS